MDAGAMPAEGDAPAAPPKPTRLHPAKGHDNAWWWEGIDRGEILIQKCEECGILRHPPRPMCGECRSTKWGFIASAGSGTIYSYVVIHYPEVPGYEYPLVIAVIDLDEGTRIVANIVDCPFEDIHIGMKVEAGIEEIGGLRIPVFRKVG